MGKREQQWEGVSGQKRGAGLTPVRREEGSGVGGERVSSYIESLGLESLLWIGQGG